MQERDKKRTVSLRINNLLMESKTHGGTAEDNGMLTKQVVCCRTSEKRKFTLSELKTKASACTGEKFLTWDTRDTNALEKHVPEMRLKVLNIALPCTDIDANSDRCSESRVSITKLSTMI